MSDLAELRCQVCGRTFPTMIQLNQDGIRHEMEQPPIFITRPPKPGAGKG